MKMFMIQVWIFENNFSGFLAMLPKLNAIIWGLPWEKKKEYALKYKMTSSHKLVQ